MTDKETLITLLMVWGVGFTELTTDNELTVRCTQGEAKVEGYCSFFTDFIFNLDGSFNYMGAYE